MQVRCNIPVFRPAQSIVALFRFVPEKHYQTSDRIFVAPHYFSYYNANVFTSTHLHNFNIW